MFYENELLEPGGAERLMTESPARFFHLLEEIAEGVVQATSLDKGVCWDDSGWQIRAAALAHGFSAYAGWLRTQINEFSSHHTPV